MNILSRLKLFSQFLLKSTSDFNIAKFGVNCFFNQPLFKTNNIESQAFDIKENLKINTVRILFNWDEHAQPKPNVPLNFSFLDDILKNCKKNNLKALVVISGLPSWAPTHFTSAKETTDAFVAVVTALFTKYGNHPSVWGFQIANEVNTSMFPLNKELDLIDKPENYVKLLKTVFSNKKGLASTKPIVSSSTTSILQSFPNTLDYNKDLVKAGVLDYCDIFAVHVYGSNLWAMFKPDGVLDFIQSVKKTVWVTEIGTHETSEHLNYFKKYVPYLLKVCPNVGHIFWYQYDGGLDTVRFGLRNARNQLSKLYNFLYSSVSSTNK